jgi:hypothetical protein
MSVEIGIPILTVLKAIVPRDRASWAAIGLRVGEVTNGGNDNLHMTVA